MDVLVQRFVTERDEKAELIRSLARNAEEEGRDLVPTEVETIKRAKERIAELDVQVDTVTGDLEMSEAAVARVRQLNVGSLAGSYDYGSAGEWIHDLVLRSRGDTAAGDRMARYVKTRAAEHMGTVAPHSVTPTGTLNPGLVPDPIVGPILNFVDSSRPFVTAVGARAVPGGPTFHRPQLVDANLDTGVGIQGGDVTAPINTVEKAELASKAFQIVRLDVTMETFGGYVNVSQQLLGYSDPSAYQIIVDQLATRYARLTEKSALTRLAVSTGKEVLVSAAPADDVQQAIANAKAKVYAATGNMATWIAMGPLGQARLEGLTDAALRPMFPWVGPANANGQMGAAGVGTVMGLAPIVTYAIADDTFWVGNGDVFEFYEKRWGVLQVVEPSVLGLQIAFAGDVGSLLPNNGAIHIAP